MSDVSDIACRAVWVAVIHRALQDLVSETDTDESIDLFRDCYRWFFFSSSNFKLVCSFAGIEPCIVRKRAREILNNPALLGGFYV